MQMSKFDGIEVPKRDERDDLEIPYCPKCQGKQFVLTEADTVCAKCGKLFVDDNVPWRPMKKGESDATVQRTDGSAIYIPDKIQGRWDPDMGAYWDVFTNRWTVVRLIESVEVPEDDNTFHRIVRGELEREIDRYGG
jgi:hypothetical protein